MYRCNPVRAGPAYGLPVSPNSQVDSTTSSTSFSDCKPRLPRYDPLMNRVITTTSKRSPTSISGPSEPDSIAPQELGFRRLQALGRAGHQARVINKALEASGCLERLEFSRNRHADTLGGCEFGFLSLSFFLWGVADIRRDINSVEEREAARSKREEEQGYIEDETRRAEFYDETVKEVVRTVRRPFNLLLVCALTVGRRFDCTAGPTREENWSRFCSIHRKVSFLRPHFLDCYKVADRESWITVLVWVGTADRASGRSRLLHRHRKRWKLENLQNLIPTLAYSNYTSLRIWNLSVVLNLPSPPHPTKTHRFKNQSVDFKPPSKPLRQYSESKKWRKTSSDSMKGWKRRM